QFRRDDSNEIAVLIEERSAGVARLNRRGNLIEPAVVANPGERRHDAGGEVAARRENLAQGIAERLHVLSLPRAETERAHKSFGLSYTSLLPASSRFSSSAAAALSSSSS